MKVKALSRFFVVICLLVLGLGLGSAQSLDDKITECATVENSEERLQCYDDIAAELMPSEVLSEVPAVSFESTAQFTVRDQAHVIGVVKNNTGSTLEFVKIVADIFDAEGNVIAEDFAYTRLKQLLPNQSSSFDVSFPKPEGLKRFTATVQYKVTTDTVYQDFVVEEQETTIEEDKFELVGTISNPYDQPMKFVKAVVTVFDSEKDIVGTGFSFIDMDVLPAGELSSFDVNLRNVVGVVDSYNVQVEGVPDN